MMLRENKHLWGQYTLEEAISRKDIQWPDEMDDEDDNINPTSINVTLDSDNEGYQINYILQMYAYL